MWTRLLIGVSALAALMLFWLAYEFVSFAVTFEPMPDPTEFSLNYFCTETCV